MGSAAAAAPAPAAAAGAGGGPAAQTFQTYSAAACLSADGSKLVTVDCAASGDVRLWTLPDGVCRTIIAGYAAGDPEAVCAALTANGSRLAIGGIGPQVHVIDNSTGAVAATLNGPEGALQCLVFSADGSRLSACCTSGEVTVWSLEGLAAPGAAIPFAPPAVSVASIQVPTKVSQLAFAPDNSQLVIAGVDMVHLWLLSKGTVTTHKGSRGTLGCITYSPNGAFIAAASDKDSIRIWNTQTASSAQLRGKQHHVGCLAFSPDSCRLVTAGQSESGGHTLCVWDLRTHACVVSLEAPAELGGFKLLSVVSSNSGISSGAVPGASSDLIKVIAVTEDNRGLLQWDLTTGALLPVLVPGWARQPSLQPQPPAEMDHHQPPHLQQAPAQQASQQQQLRVVKQEQGVEEQQAGRDHGIGAAPNNFTESDMSACMMMLEGRQASAAPTPSSSTRTACFLQPSLSPLLLAGASPAELFAAVGSAQKQGQLLAADLILAPLQHRYVDGWGGALVDVRGMRVEVVGFMHQGASQEAKAQHLHELNAAAESLLQWAAALSSASNSSPRPSAAASPSNWETSVTIRRCQEGDSGVHSVTWLQAMADGRPAPRATSADVPALCQDLALKLAAAAAPSGPGMEE